MFSTGLAVLPYVMVDNDNGLLIDLHTRKEDYSMCSILFPTTPKSTGLVNMCCMIWQSRRLAASLIGLYKEAKGKEL